MSPVGCGCKTPLVMAGKSTLKKFLLLATFCRELLPKKLSLHARYGAKKNLFPGLVEFGGVLVQIQKLLAEEVERCLGGLDAHSRESGDVLKAIARS